MYVRHFGFAASNSRALLRRVSPPPARSITLLAAGLQAARRQRRLRAHRLRRSRLETTGQIVGQIAHDYNNLLGPLAGYPELIKLSLPPDHPAIAYCDVMLSAVRQITEMGEPMLALGRRARHAAEPVDLSDIARQALLHLDPLPPGVGLRRHLAERLPLVDGRAPQLVRAVLNLLTNAREAMPERGTLTVATGRVRLDRPGATMLGVAPGEYVRLSVADTGHGIPVELHERIFEPYFSTRRNPNRRGAGLGLSVVDAIVADHGGAVQAASEPGQGATISIYLPVPPAETAPASTHAAVPVSLSHRVPDPGPS